MLLIQIDSSFKALSVESNTDFPKGTKERLSMEESHPSCLPKIQHFCVKMFLWRMCLHCHAALQLTGASIWILVPSPADTHIINHCNDLFSLCFAASLWMKFTKKMLGEVNMTRRRFHRVRMVVNKEKGPTFFTCASLIFSKATRILSAFNLAACSS